MYREIILFTVLLILTITNGNSILERKSINKCCPIGQHVGKRRSCVKYNKTLLNFSNIKVYNNDIKYIGRSVEDVFDFTPGKFEDEYFKPECVDVTEFDFNLYVLQNGDLTLELPNAYTRWTYIKPTNYCIDYRLTKHKIIPHYWVILNTEEFDESNPYFTIATLVSCFFMLLVLIVYFLLPELQNLCGLILMAYVASLFMAFLLLSIIQIQLHTIEACIGLTLGIYFSFLATFCWMSVMSYDIWWTFRGYAKARAIHRRGERFKFLMYCLYAWGLPLAMTIGLAILIGISDKMRDYPWFITPNLPKQGCFLESGVKLLYLYTPMLILIFCNWMFYLMTAFNIWRLSRGTAVLDTAAAGNPQAHRTHRHRFMVYLKLSVVMGLNWVLEVVSFLFPGFKMWYMTDAYNILIGLAIFLIFVCKKKIWKQLCKRYLNKNSMRWTPSSKSYSSSASDTQETSTLQSKVSPNPSGVNGYSMVSIKNKYDDF